MTNVSIVLLEIESAKELGIDVKFGTDYGCGFCTLNGYPVHSVEQIQQFVAGYKSGVRAAQTHEKIVSYEELLDTLSSARSLLYDRDCVDVNIDEVLEIVQQFKML